MVAPDSMMSPRHAAKKNRSPSTAKARKTVHKPARRSTAPSVERIAGISNDAVAAKTGKPWANWIELLDRAGAKKMKHKDIAELLQSQYGVGDWWSQMVTVGYEQARGLRIRHQTARGFQISRSKTIAASASAIYQAWIEPKLRQRWLRTGPLTIRSSTRNKVVRLNWTDGISNVETRFESKGPAKTQVVVQHNKLPDERSALKMKEFWSNRLPALQRFVNP